MLDDERFINHKNHLFDSQPLQTIQRKISKQKNFAENHIEQSNGDEMFESSSFENDHILRHSTNSRMLHENNDIILTNDFQYEQFHQPNTRKITKIIPKENNSLTNNRPIQLRSTSASNIKRENKDSSLTSNDIQRLKHVRRHEPAHVQSDSKTSLITPESWKTDPVVIKRSSRNKSTIENVNKPTKINNISKPIIEQPKRDTSASKSTIIERISAKSAPPSTKIEKTKEEKEQEKEKIKKYIQEKREQHEKKILDEKNKKIIQENERKDNLKKLYKETKKVSQQPLPSSLIKKSATTTLTNDLTEQKRERLLNLLGPREPTEYHNNIPFEQPSLHERSSSSSSSSSDSVIEIQPSKLNDKSYSEPPIQNGIMNDVKQRHHNILRWANNLTRDCDAIENKFKYFRPDGTQQFDIIPSSQKQHKYDDGNLRFQTPVRIDNNNTDSKPIIPSKIIRPSGRLSHLNQNHTSEYQGQQLPGVGNLRDPLLERRIKRDRAATKIQAAYRGHTVRKSLHWINGKQQQLHSEFNKRPIHKSTKNFSNTTDIRDAPAINLDIRFTDDNFTIGSTLLRNYQRNGNNTMPLKSPRIFDRSEHEQKPTALENYSDDYENFSSTTSSSMSIKQQRTPQKPRVIQQPISNTKSTSSSTSPPSSSSLTPTPEPVVHSNIQRRRSISPPIPPEMSPDNGRPIRYPQRPSPPPITTTTFNRILDERRYSPDALERQLNAELNLLDGVEASMKQIDNMERLRSVALAQQEVVSLAQALKNKPSADSGTSQQQIRKHVAREISSVSSSSSSSSSSNRKHRSPSPQHSSSKTKHSHHRITQSPGSSSSESIFTKRQKHVHQKFHNETELQAYEKRLTDIEKQIRILVKNAPEVLDEKRNISTLRVSSKSSDESSISEHLPISHKSSSSTNGTVQRKKKNDTGDIHTATIGRDSDSSSTSIHQQNSDIITTDASDIERRIRSYREQLKKKEMELNKLKHEKTKEVLRKQEDELKKQLQTATHEIEKLRLQPEPKIPVPSHQSPLRSRNNSGSSTTSIEIKPQESSISEDLPVATTSQSKTDNIINKPIEQNRPIVKKIRDFFDDDDEEEEEKPQLKPLETPRDERDTRQDAQSISIATDLSAASETDNDSSRRPSSDNEKSILNLNINLPSLLKPQKDSESSSSSTTTATSKKSSKQQIQSRSFERKPSPITNDYDEDFSDTSHSRTSHTKESLSKPKIDNIDIESIQEDLNIKQSLHDTSQSSSSKSSGDEQSEILVLVKKSATNTPRKQDDKTPNEEERFRSISPPPSPPKPVQQQQQQQPKIELNNNDDTSDDVSDDNDDDESNQRIEQEHKIDKLTESLIRTFIDEAIGQGKQIERLKKETNILTQEAKEWMSDDDDITDEENSKPIIVESNGFALDLSRLDEKSSDEPRIESPRKIIIEEQVKLLVPHTREQVIELCHEALKILFDQNKDFSNRSAIKCQIPNSYFKYDEQDSDNENIRRNHHAYCQMIFDLCIELLNEMYTENIQLEKYPEWQKTKLISKRFYRGNKTNNRHYIEQFIETKILEILNLNTRQIKYSKWRVSNGTRNGKEKFEIILDEEIRRTESQWIDYDDDCMQLKFDIADSILDQLIQETITECLDIVDRRFFFSSNSTRL
ncbi:unnamed protein product [Rotaria sordida]|uniref:DUF4378 domain-containing protein n=1 Tax=Rotaria sordida TaxID=392033 RepID=A0A814TU30_9BILA|nr:unnamed protein product [Rotaria sordida]CAF1416904.1 unnamed protein product [Rotaria sordida]